MKKKTITSLLFLFLTNSPVIHIQFTPDMHMLLFCSACVASPSILQTFVSPSPHSFFLSFTIIVLFSPPFYVSSCHFSSVFSPLSHYLKARLLASWIFYLSNIHTTFWQCYYISQIATLTTKDGNVIRKEAQRSAIKWVKLKKKLQKEIL